MAFPVSPVDGQTSTVNNIVYTFSSGNNTWTRSSTGFVNLGASGNISATGNIIGGNLLTTGLISATGNITGNFILGNGSQLTGIITSVSNVANGGSNLNISAANANVTISVSTVGNIAVFSPTGVSILGTIAGNGNITGGNILTAGIMSSTGNAIHGNILTAGLISATGNVYSGGNLIVGTAPYSNTGISGTAAVVSAAYLLTTASGSDLMWTRRQAAGLFQIQTFNGSNSGTLAVQPYGGQLTVGFGASNSVYTLDVAGTANISGNITTGGLISATGNITGNYFIGNGSQLTGIVGENVVLNDISNQFDNITSVFALRNGQSNVTNINDSRDLQVVVGGQTLSPYVTLANWPFVGPFFTPYDSYRGFRVKSNSVSSNVIIYNSPAVGDQATLTIINTSKTVQTRLYPYSPETIALGD